MQQKVIINDSVRGEIVSVVALDKTTVSVCTPNGCKRITCSNKDMALKEFEKSVHHLQIKRKPGFTPHRSIAYAY